MAAPAGVNEGSPQEPISAGLAQADLAEAEAAEAEPAEGELAEVTPLEAEHLETESAEAELGETEPAAAEPAAAEPAAAEPAAAEPAELALAQADSAEGEPTWEAQEAGEEREGREGREGRDMSPLGITAIVLGIIALVGVAVGVLAVITHGFRPKTVITYRPAAVFGLRPGECINSGPNALAVTVLSCATPHDAEVFATFSLTASSWPGGATVQQDASNGCMNKIGGYLNPQLAAADLTQEYVYPNQASWQAGERTVICEVRASSGQLTGSVRKGS